MYNLLQISFFNRLSTSGPSQSVYSIPEFTGSLGLLFKEHREFTIQDQLQSINVALNILPFVDGKQQLSANEVQQGRSTVPLRIHAERALGCYVRKGAYTLKMVHLVNQIIFVCAMLTNFFLLLSLPHR